MTLSEAITHIQKQLKQGLNTEMSQAKDIYYTKKHSHKSIKKRK